MLVVVLQLDVRGRVDLHLDTQKGHQEAIQSGIAW